MRKTSDNICQDYGLGVLSENSFYKETINRYERNSTYLNLVRDDIDYAIAQAKNYNEFTSILKAMGYELTNKNNVLSIRKEPYKRNIRLPRTFGEEYTRDSILFRIKHTTSFKLPFPEVRTRTGKLKRKSKISVRHKTKAKGLRALYLYYCYLLKIFPNKKSKGKVSQYMREEIKKLDQFSNVTRFLGKYKIATLAEVKDYRTNTVKELNKLKGTRENLWRKHKRIKTSEEGQAICSQIQFLVIKIDELNTNIKLCNFIEERSLQMKENVKEMSQEIKVKVKSRDRDYR